MYAALLVTDLVALTAGFVLIKMTRGSIPMAWPHSIILMVLPIYAMIALNYNAYSLMGLDRVSFGIWRALKSVFLTTILILLIAYFLRGSSDISRRSIVMASAIGALFLAVLRLLLYRSLIARLAPGGRPIAQLVLVDGVAPPPYRDAPVCDVTRIALRPDLGDPKKLELLAHVVAGFDRVIIAAGPDRAIAWAKMLKGANVRGEVVMPDLEKFGPLGISSFAGLTTLTVSTGPLSLRSRVQKRVFDLAVAIPVLIFLAPFLLCIAVAIWLEDGGPVLFKQKRVGLANRSFEVYKFRSMRHEACDADGTQSTERNDGRVTRVGRFIRMTSLDELPQLLNVLLGDMSLVGPRPHALGSLAGERLFWEIDERYWRRHAIKPGITGLAQVRGFRGATEDPSDLLDRLQADLEYQQNWSIGRDILILLQTARVLVHSKAY
jgi:lipopolysaccharide/colanic/teichoic acid biosynthesis glycosyltransferase